MLALGFTGTQHGMTARQRAAFVRVLEAINPTHFHHGDCVGSDCEAHSVVRALLPRCRVHVHPPSENAKRAFCRGDYENLALPYLTRNRHIVRASHYLVATPQTKDEQIRSGTWATVRYGRDALGADRVYVLPPDCTFTYVVNQVLKVFNASKSS